MEVGRDQFNEERPLNEAEVPFLPLYDARRVSDSCALPSAIVAVCLRCSFTSSRCCD